MKRWLLVLVLLAAACGAAQHTSVPLPHAAGGTCHYRVEAGQPLPDPGCTPGALNPAVHLGTVGATVCTPGWTKTIRPNLSTEKRTAMRQYGVGGQPTRAFELDHLVPLSVGGAPMDPHNLWPELITDARRKDTAEVRIQHDICAGRLTLQQAQAVFLSDKWLRYESGSARQLVD